MKCFLKVKNCSYPVLSANIIHSYKFKSINYRQCNICGLQFQYPIKKVEIKKIYDQNYYNNYYTNKVKNNLYNERKLQYNLDKKIFLKYFVDKKNKSILDYGCGNGEFLIKFKSKKYGFEINQNIEKMKKIEYITSKQILKKKFDAIFLRGVIEHIPDFAIVIPRLINRLKKNGLFFISATPNTKNVSFFLNKKSFKLNDKAHLYHFDYINLSIFFLKNCLYNIHTSLEYWDTPYKKISYDYNIQKKLLKSFNYNKKSNEISSPGVGNIMTLVYKKMLK